MNTLDKVYDLTIDIKNIDVKYNSYAKFFDDDRETSVIRIKLLNDKTPIDLEGCTVEAEFILANNTYHDETCKIINSSEGVVELQLCQKCLVKGENIVRLSILKENEIANTPVITYEVKKGLYSDNPNFNDDPLTPVLSQMLLDVKVTKANQIELQERYEKSLPKIEGKIKEVESLINRVDTAIASGTQDLEVKEARDGEVSLKTRLDRDIEKVEQVYVELDGLQEQVSNIDSQLEQKANKNDLQFVNVKWFGAKGDGVTDDTQSIQDAIDYAYNNGIEEVYMPLGEYKITKTLNLHFNLKLKGAGSFKTYIIVSEDIVDYALIYGDGYSYGKSKGEISSLCFKSSSDVCVSKGVYLNSGIKFYDFYCYKLKSSIHTNNGKYIDNLKIINSTFAYCCGGEDFYVIDLQGNMDSLEIEGVHIVDAYTDSSVGESSFSRHRGLKVYGSTGGYIKNCIINNCIILNNVHGFSIENLHNEGSQHSNYKGNKSYIKIINSNVGIYNSYLHKRIDGENIIIANNNNIDTHDAGNISLNNVIIDFTSNVYKYIDGKTLTPEIIKTNFTTLKLNNCFVRHNFSSNWTTTNELRGVTIRDIQDFNQHSSYLSYNCLIGNDNNISTDTPMVSRDANITNSNMLTYSSSSVKIPWHIDETDKTYYINCVVCFDYKRKLALIRNMTEQTIANVGKDKGILIRYNKSVYVDSKGLEFVYYRGETSGVYNKICRLPLSMSYYIFDTGTHTMGVKVSDRAPSGVDEFNYVEKARTINNGKNVEFYSSVLPTCGEFNKYDKCINTNIREGQIKEWIYNGSEWISLGVY